MLCFELELLSLRVYILTWRLDFHLNFIDFYEFYWFKIIAKRWNCSNEESTLFFIEIYIHFDISYSVEFISLISFTFTGFIGLKQHSRWGENECTEIILVNIFSVICYPFCFHFWTSEMEGIKWVKYLDHEKLSF